MDESFNPYAAPKSDLMPKDNLEPILSRAVFPLFLKFKIIAIAPQINVIDSQGQTILHVKQKLLKLKEHIEIFTDNTRQTRLAEIRAENIIDWSARYHFTDAWGQAIGKVGRKGWRSLWKAHYECFNPGDDQPDFSIKEENPWAKVVDSFLGQIPIIGGFTGYFCHPRFLATRLNSNAPAMRIEKLPAFWEGKFRVDLLGPTTSRETLNLILSFIMLLLLERRRG